MSAVTSAMRSSPRWAQAAGNAQLNSAASGTAALSLTRTAYTLARADAAPETEQQGHVGLLGGFTVLRAQLRLVPDVTSLPLPAVLSHFSRVIVNAQTTGAVTLFVLDAVAAFLEQGLFRTNSVGLVRAVQDVAHATSHCRFEPLDASKDEVVLLALLDVMEALVGGHALNADGTNGPVLVEMLGNKSVCEMLETCLSIGCQARLSAALRRSAEDKMRAMTRAIFSRLYGMPNESRYEPELATLTAEPVGEDAGKGIHRMATPDPKSFSISEATADRDALEEQAQATDSQTMEESGVLPGDPAGASAPLPAEPVAEPAAEPTMQVDKEEEEARAEELYPFGLPALTEVLRVLVSLLDAQSTRHTATMRILGLRLLTDLFETHGKIIGQFPTLRVLIEDSGCRHLFQLADSDNGVLVSGSLRLFGVLLDTMGDHLKLQKELLLLFLMQQLQPSIPIQQEPWGSTEGLRYRATTLPGFGSAATGETRELFLEMLTMLLDLPSENVFVDLWRNYDCDLQCSNVHDELVGFLCRSIFSLPASEPAAPRAAMSGLQVVALDLVLVLLARMAARLEAPVASPEIELLLAQHARKQVLADGAAAFNQKPRQGIAFLEREGLVDTTQGNEVRAQGIARFLKESPLVDKRLLGDYLSRPENLDILAAFMALFDFYRVDVAEAMRALCEAFRLPGEAQQIARVTETFASAYYSCKPEGIRSEDAVYVLAYSIIMLNTDLHNPQVTRRMSVTDYKKNLRGVNDGEDFDPDMLATIYEGIRRREIVMPEEHAGQLGFDYLWKQLLRKIRPTDTLQRTAGTALDRELFRQSWRPFVASIIHAFAVLQDEHLLQRTIAGCRQCAVLARAFDVTEMFDYMVHHFALATRLVDSPTAKNTAGNAEHTTEQATIIISPLSVEFGTNFKSQLASVVLFAIANGNGGAIRSGWDDILAVFESLLPNGLLPPQIACMYDPASQRRVPIPLKAKKGPAVRSSSQSQGGLFSTLSSYFLSPYGNASDQMEVTEADVDSTLCTSDCLASCKIEELYAQIAALPDDALGAFLEAVQHRLARLDKEETALEYSPTILFLLEQLVDGVISRASLCSAHGEKTLSLHRAILERAVAHHPLELERALVGITRMIGAEARYGMPAKNDVCALLAQLQQIPEALHAAISPAVLGVLLALLRTTHSLLSARQEWLPLQQVVTMYAAVRREQSVRLSFALASFLLDHACTPANYALLIEMTRELISSADRAMWLVAREHAQARRTLTEQREQSDWQAAVQSESLVALAALERVKSHIPSLLGGTENLQQAWGAYWLPLFAALAQQCVNANRAARQAAVVHLQRAVLTPEVLKRAPPQMAVHLEAVFHNILLPLLETLLQPETLRADLLVQGDVEGDTIYGTRANVCLLLCKAWVHYHGKVGDELCGAAVDPAALQRFSRLWLGVLKAVVHFLKSKSISQHEAVTEQLKNILLVMHAGGFLTLPGVWDATWRVVDPVRPGMRAEVDKSGKSAERGGAEEDGARASVAEASAVEANGAEINPADANGADAIPAETIPADANPAEASGTAMHAPASPNASRIVL
ncbi:GDP/GTP exchange factor for ARF [Malassezia vespertilionis]|uniref:GDP/GTP exchange factor for ARF n=1 Tax=Malassezia vespertilionis TaxID=2020962 RepID=UPI0024B0F107|nr:GDP/GTP exchange factor for ARF [Malassezia vespertilionis]WFD07354.1 GDP/GTP exchange factor for ARF [Malassezia vespertilionis]